MRVVNQRERAYVDARAECRRLRRRVEELEATVRAVRAEVEAGVRTETWPRWIADGLLRLLGTAPKAPAASRDWREAALPRGDRA